MMIPMEDDIRERSILREMNYDQLTGLPSMTYFFKLAEAGRRSMQEREVPSVVVYINFCGMKDYNSRFGFSEGDALIRDFARVLSGIFGEEMCSRFGQDHFALLTQAQDFEHKIRRLFDEMKTCNGGRSVPIRVGVYPDSMGMVEISLACDRAKYACGTLKDKYRSSFCYFDDRMLQKELNRQYIIDNLDRAIRENWIMAYYQPIVRAANRRVCDEEALARWIDPQKGMLSPADFIPILEDTRLIYRVDLHIVEVVLEKLKKQAEAGLARVPISVNLSRTDFEMCDIVEEICSRVDASGIPRNLITVEITESVVGENFDYMKEQVKRFRDLGFQVWMDDFGSGYSSLDLLQEIHFDLIKFDMRFMRQFEESPKSRIILKELMRMALSLGMETVCEGVETMEQVQFLSEIGCTKLQGYHFCKPIPMEEILARYEKGIQIGFEDPEEVGYYEAISTINLYDLGSVANEDADTVRNYYDTLPMAVIEYDGKRLRVIRCNRSYKDYLRRYFGIDSVGEIETVEDVIHHAGSTVIDAMDRCREEKGDRAFIDEKLYDGSTVHSMIRKVADRPRRSGAAYAVAVLAITPKREYLDYASVARALSSDYIKLYYVDLDTEAFQEYSSDGSERDLFAERVGEHFFDQALHDGTVVVYEDDRKKFSQAFTRERVISAIEEQGAFHLSYRLMLEGKPTYVNLKAVHMNADHRHIVIGINNVDTQTRQQETIEKLMEEQSVYSRISALMGDFLAIYTVDPESGSYMAYHFAEEYEELKTSRLGTDFFEDSRREIERLICPEDLKRFRAGFTRERVLKEVKNGGTFKMHYRLLLGGEPVMMTLRAGLIEEQGRTELIVGVRRRTPDVE